MREDVVTPATARRLAHEGLPWEPHLGDWCVTLDGAQIGEREVGLWLVVATAPNQGMLALADPAGRWPQTPVAARDCLWLPTAGKLKTWLRAQGYRVATGEAPAIAPALAYTPFGGASGSLGALNPQGSTLHVCRLTHPADRAIVIDGEGVSEPEAVAVAILQLLAARQAAGWTPS